MSSWRANRAVVTLVVVGLGDGSTLAMERHTESARASARTSASGASGGADRHPRWPAQKHVPSSNLRVATLSRVMVGVGAPRGVLLARFGALFVFRASARAQDGSSTLAAQAEGTTKRRVLATGAPESPGQWLLGKPSPARKGAPSRRSRVRESGVILVGVRGRLEFGACLPTAHFLSLETVDWLRLDRTHLRPLFDRFILMFAESESESVIK